MFKKLKDKIAEEVKISPQRIQQLTQSVTDRIGQSVSTDDSLFSIGEDDIAPSNTSNTEPGFSNISLTNTYNPEDRRIRRNSSSSISSEMSFLPRYESSANMYHLQSDLDISASEMEDNASTSSQLGHVSKEQVLSAFQKSQMRYHKYRGRYTDLANHYKELERENAKMKSVLVETQDKAIRRVAELKEQCNLEQKAKAHLENMLRVELDEKQCIIDTLKQKIQLLQSSNGAAKTANLLDLSDDHPKNDNRSKENLEILTKDLHDARTEIESLNAKLQEYKANSIVFQSKETEYKQKINDLEKKVEERARECAELNEREKENNLTLAQVKKELHTEIHNKDAEIAFLKQELDQNIAKLKMSTQSSKLENLQSQNTKIIEKMEMLSQKCNNYEKELIKLEQYKLENDGLKDQLSKIQQEVSSLDTKDFVDLGIITQFSSKDVHSQVKEKLMMVEEIREEKKQLKIRIDDLAEKLESANREKENLKKSYDEISNQRDSLKIDLNSLGEIKKDLEELSKKHSIILEENQSLKEKQSELETILQVFNETKEEATRLQKSLTQTLSDVEALKEKNLQYENTLKQVQECEALKEDKDITSICDKLKKKLLDIGRILGTQDESSNNDFTDLRELLTSLVMELESLKMENHLEEDLRAKYDQLVEENNVLNDKCNNWEDLTTRYREVYQENEVLKENLKDSLKRSEKLEVEYQIKLEKEREGTKQSLLMLESRVEEKLSLVFSKKENELQEDFAEKLKTIATNKEDTTHLQVMLMHKNDEAAALRSELQKLAEYIENNDKRYQELEKNHLDLIEEGNRNRKELSDTQKEFARLEREVPHYENEMKRLKTELSLLQQVTADQQNAISALNSELSEYKVSNEKQTSDNNYLKEKLDEVSIQFETAKQLILGLQKDSLKHKELEEKNTLLEEKNKELQDIIQSLEENIKMLNGTVLEEGKKFEDSKSKIEEYLNEKSLLVAEVEEKSKLVDELLQKINDNVENVKALDESASDLNLLKCNLENSTKENKELKNNIEQLQNANSELKAALDDRKNSEEKLQVELKERENVVSDLKAKLEEKRVEINKLKQKLEEVVNITNEEKKVNEEFKTHSEDLKEKLEKLESKISMQEDCERDYQTKLDTCESELKILQKQKSNMLNENKKLHEDLQNYTVKVKDFEDQLLEISKEKEMLAKELELLKATASSAEQFKQEVNDKAKEVEKLNQNLADLNDIQNVYKVEKEALSKQIVELREYQSKYESILDENHNLKEQVSEIETLRTKLNQLEGVQMDHKKLITENESISLRIKDLEKIEKMFLNLSKENEIVKQKYTQLLIVEAELKAVNEEKAHLLSNITNLQTQINNYCSENQTLKQNLEKLRVLETKHDEVANEKEASEKRLQKAKDEFEELQKRNRQLSTDNKQILLENEKLIAELEGIKLKNESFQAENNKFEEVKAGLLNESEQLKRDISVISGELESLKAAKDLASKVQISNHDAMANETVALQTSISELQETKTKYETLVSETKSIKTQLNNLEKICENSSKEKQKLQMQIKELERQYNEICHEKQLLQDEIIELKTSPLNVNGNNMTSKNNNKLDSLQLLKAENSLIVNEGKSKGNHNYLQEIEDLREKLRQYKSLDLTNRTSIEFYENELQKMKNKNEKLNRKLDETLVTLNHCADLSNTTEIEYLRNVLYNYMLGKESLVLARVIAAVCRFDPQQTDAILQKEQQKQTLLGQLGLL